MRRMALHQRRSLMRKKAKSWCVVLEGGMTLDLKLVHQSEEDLQLRGELEMLVERLKVCTVCSFHVVD